MIASDWLQPLPKDAVFVELNDQDVDAREGDQALAGGVAQGCIFAAVEEIVCIQVSAFVELAREEGVEVEAHGFEAATRLIFSQCDAERVRGDSPGALPV